MGQKISAHGLRLGVNVEHLSNWYFEGKDYANALAEDIKIRKLVFANMKVAGLATTHINRNENIVEIIISVSKPGVAIGRGGRGIDELKKELERLTKKPVTLKINEIKKPDLSAPVIAREVADGLERRLPIKRLMGNCKEKVMNAGALGVKIQVSGRIAGAKQARTVKISDGQVPLHTIKANIDFVEDTAYVRNMGLFGIKVWINKAKE